MPEKKVDLIIKTANQLLTLRSEKKGPHGGRRMEELGLVTDGAVAAVGGEIVAIGSTDQVTSSVQVSPETVVIDAREKVVMPGFVDPHTHPVFAGTREEEFEMRIKGASYREIAESGGGIRSSVRALRRTSKEELRERAWIRLDRMLSYGTTTAEAKSGYGLNLIDEIKSLEVIAELSRDHPLDLIPTFLGAHEVPDEFREKRDEYMRQVKEEMIPLVAKRGLAEFCDVFCEDGVFDVEESRKILSAAQRAGLKLKLHADELAASGGSLLAAELGAISADHLVFVEEKGIQAMGRGDVIPVLLPGTTFSLGLDRYAPARRMIEAGLPVALATDLNPGSCMTESMPMVITLACLKLKMTPAEAITAATINAAHAVNRGHLLGSLEAGKRADVVIWDMPNYRVLPYHFGVNLVDTVIKSGRVAYRRGQFLYGEA
jgi:imidazolonepropionase